MDDLTSRVAARSVSAMAILIENVAKHDWGFWTREEPRFHIQTVDDESRKGPKAVKFWLENRGVRTLTLAKGKLSAPELHAAETAIRAEWDTLEIKWIRVMVEMSWVKAHLNGTTIVLQIYPGQPGSSFTREIDLRRALPGRFSDQVRNLDPIGPKDVVINTKNLAVEIWPDKPSSDRPGFPLEDWIFEGNP